MQPFADNALSIGNTPLVRLNRICPGEATVLAKIEGRNPAYSVKCRIGAHMVRDAEERGVLRPGMSIVEPTSGNTGIGLAFVGAARGYPVTLTMPETMSLERRRLLAAFGAELVLTPGDKGMPGAIHAARELAAADPHGRWMPQQFENPANPDVHRRTTGPEIWDATDGAVNVLVAGVGTGGTITGISCCFETDHGRDLLSVAVEPETSPVIAQAKAGAEIKGGKHKIQGIGAGFIPANLDLDLVDRVEAVNDDEAFAFARRLAREEGIIAGISSGAAAAVAARLAALPDFAGRTIVAILPDSGERYLSTPLFEA
ncbi:MAG: cysteine synthase A [Planctomycetota bacterium]